MKILKIILIAGVSLVVIFTVLIFIFLPREKEETNLNSNFNTSLTNFEEPTNLNQNENINVNTNTPKPIDETQATKNFLSRMASDFTERFGSYSNQSDYENVVNLRVYMSQSMKAWADKFVTTSRAQYPDTSIYYGITTKALSSKLVSFKEKTGQAEFLISCQRREATGSTSNAQVFYQDITVKFIKENGVWLVNEARWK